MGENETDDSFLWKTADALDRIQGMEAKAFYRYRNYLGNNTHEETASELGISTDEAKRLAYDGLRWIKDQIYD